LADEIDTESIESEEADDKHSKEDEDEGGMQEMIHETR
jgi:hypothetical protein